MSTTTKICTQCGKEKPRTEFYSQGRNRPGKIASKCKDCVNARHREVEQTQPRINRNRARHRAVADLIEAHQDEFEALYERRRVEAEEEARTLAAEQTAQRHYNGEPVRLKPGQRRKGQKPVDRIDVARCPHCITHHDRGHRCTVCGARPGTQPPAAQPPQQLPRARRTTTVDPAALAEFNAGTQRAAKASRR